MNQPYLEVTFRKGRPLAAYLYLPRPKGAKCTRSSIAGPGLVVDYMRGGRPIGVEITAPETVTLSSINKVLREVGAPPLRRADIQPLRAA